MTFANLAEPDGWAWVAEKKSKRVDRIVLVRRGNIMALRVALMQEGFDVPTGSAAEKVMRAAVRCGFAEELPDDERWRTELLRARAGISPRQ